MSKGGNEQRFIMLRGLDAGSKRLPPSQGDGVLQRGIFPAAPWVDPRRA